MAATVLFSFLFVSSDSQWISYGGMPRKDRDMAIGFMNSTIFILGGNDNPQQVTTFDSETNTFTDNGVNQLAEETFGYSQFYTQLKNKVYIIDPNEPRINFFDLETQTFAPLTDIPVDVQYEGCLAASPSNLIVVGGTNYDGDVPSIQIFSIDAETWTNGPKMLTPRTQFSCIVHPSNWDQVYAIAGIGGEDLNSIERINIGGTSQYVDNLPHPTESTSAVVHLDKILILGGVYFNGGGDYVYLNTVNVLDPKTGKVTLSQDRMVYGVIDTSAISVGNSVYAFGGMNKNQSTINTWMKYTYTGQ